VRVSLPPGESRPIRELLSGLPWGSLEGTAKVAWATPNMQRDLITLGLSCSLPDRRKRPLLPAVLAELTAMLARTFRPDYSIAVMLTSLVHGVAVNGPRFVAPKPCVPSESWHHSSSSLIIGKILTVTMVPLFLVMAA
jgi:hypothetical protein